MSFAVSAAVASLTVVGCSAGGVDVSTGAPAEASGTSAAATLPPLEYEAPPQYPDNMEVDSSENAIRFMEFAIETLNYAQRFNDVEAIQAISVPECQFCNGIVETFGSLRDQGYRTIGGDLTCSYLDGEYQPATGLFFLYTDCTMSEGATYDGNGEIVELLSASETSVKWVMTMINGPWQLVNAATTAEGNAP